MSVCEWVVKRESIRNDNLLYPTATLSFSMMLRILSRELSLLSAEAV